jgi:hypothetical protein
MFLKSDTGLSPAKIPLLPGANCLQQLFREESRLWFVTVFRQNLVAEGKNWLPLSQDVA